MADVWRVTVGDKVQESESFTPLAGILQKLCNARKPFKVGFGKMVQAEVAGGTTYAPLAETESTSDDDF